MAEILHRMAAKATTTDKIYQALTTIEGLSAWWTEDTTGVGNETGGQLQFRFGAGGFDMEVTKLVAGQLVEWTVTGGEREWIGSRIAWELKPAENGYGIVLFRHSGWKKQTEFMHHCSTKWAIFLMSLKSLLETGKGLPAPGDVKVDDWN